MWNCGVFGGRVGIIGQGGKKNEFLPKKLLGKHHMALH